MTKLFFASLLFLCFVCLTKTDEDVVDTNFLEDLRTQLNAQNQNDSSELIPAPLSCEYSLDEQLVLKCDSGEQLAALKLSGLTLTSIPSSISMYSESLVKVVINAAELSSFGEGFGSLKQLKYLDVGNNRLTSIPPNFSSFSNLRYLYLDSNSLSTLPDKLSSLTSLGVFYLKGNPSLKVNTDMFKEMDFLATLDVSDTLISGSKLTKVHTFSCSSSCVSDDTCTKNESCPCLTFNSSFCADGCAWCVLSDTCLPSIEECRACDSYNPTNCPLWCSARCGECSMINDSIKCVSPCSWCSSSNSCKSSTEDCPKDNDTNNDVNKDDSDSSSTTIILICVLIPVVVLVIVLVILFFFLRKRYRIRKSLKMLEDVCSSMDTTSITLEDTDHQDTTNKDEHSQKEDSTKKDKTTKEDVTEKEDTQNGDANQKKRHN